MKDLHTRPGKGVILGFFGNTAKPSRVSKDLSTNKLPGSVIRFCRQAWPAPT